MSNIYRIQAFDSEMCEHFGIKFVDSVLNNKE